jgi:hypothetical protein
LPWPKGSRGRKFHADAVNTGKRLVLILCLIGAGLLLPVPHARAPAAHEPGLLAAAELAPPWRAAMPLDCNAEAVPRRPDLRFERITSDPDADEMRELMSRGGQRIVAFEWDDGTGELGYSARPALTSPAVAGVVVSSLVAAGCVSR